MDTDGALRVSLFPRGNVFVSPGSFGLCRYSTIGRLLGCTGINGRADGQFSILAGVAVGPDGLLFVSDRDTQSHVDVLRIEVEGSQVASNLSEVLTADTRIIVPLSTGSTSRPDSKDGSTQGRKFSIIDPETGVKKVSIEPGAIDEAASTSVGGDVMLTEGVAGPSSGRGSPAKSTRSQGKSGLGKGGLDTSIDGMSLDRGAWTAHSQGQGWATGAPTQTGSFKTWERKDAGGGAAGGGVTTFLRHGHTVPMRASGITFVADSDNHCLQVLRADGTHLRRIGAYGSAGGQFNSVQGVAVLCEQNADTYLLYAADTCNHRVQVGAAVLNLPIHSALHFSCEFCCAISGRQQCCRESNKCEGDFGEILISSLVRTTFVHEIRPCAPFPARVFIQVLSL